MDLDYGLSMTFGGITVGWLTTAGDACPDVMSYRGLTRISVMSDLGELIGIYPDVYTNCWTLPDEDCQLQQLGRNILFAQVANTN